MPKNGLPDLRACLMPRGDCHFRKRDMRIAIKAAQEAGVEIGRIEVDNDGKIIIIPAKEAAKTATNEPEPIL